MSVFIAFIKTAVLFYFNPLRFGGETVSLYSPGWPGTHYVDQSGPHSQKSALLECWD